MKLFIHSSQRLQYHLFVCVVIRVLVRKCVPCIRILVNLTFVPRTSAFSCTQKKIKNVSTVKKIGEHCSCVPNVVGFVVLCVFAFESGAK